MGNLREILLQNLLCYKVYFVQVGENGLGKTGWGKRVGENGLKRVKTGWEKNGK